MKTTHRVIFGNAKNMKAIESKSADLVVTSPPYPMIQMWDEMFSSQSAKIKEALRRGRGLEAFELMHKELDAVWDEVWRILKYGGFACINIGDATRTVDDSFMLYPNHSRILTYFLKLGFTSLPAVLWRKQTNAPNKFMGSGMLPAGAYVTLEHEYILILRKGGKREFVQKDKKANRHSSALFWEERNTWFSDIWMDLKGATQKLADETVRKRSAAYRFEVPYRLINMYSVKGDLVVDPFFGIGTTMIAAMAAGRNSIGYEIASDFKDTITARIDTAAKFANQRIESRLQGHIDFVEERFNTKGGFKHKNSHYNFPVITSQERELILNKLISIKKTKKNQYEANYSEKPQKKFCGDWAEYFQAGPTKPASKKRVKKPAKKKQVQLSLLD